MLAPSAGILERSWSFFEVGNKFFAMVGASCLEQGKKRHPRNIPQSLPEAINEGDRDMATKIPPSHKRWGRSADTLVLESYCITLCDGCDPLCGAEST